MSGLSPLHATLLNGAGDLLSIALLSIALLSIAPIGVIEATPQSVASGFSDV
jgi:hypothetical protein